MPPGKTREYFHPGDPRPNSPLDRSVALNTTTRRGILRLPSPRRISLTPPPSLLCSFIDVASPISMGERGDTIDSRRRTMYYGLLTREESTDLQGRSYAVARAAANWRCPPPLFPPLSSSVSRRVLAPLPPLSTVETALHRRRDAANHFCGLLTRRWRVWHSRDTEIIRKISLRGTRVKRYRWGETRIFDGARSEKTLTISQVRWISRRFRDIVVRLSWWSDANFFT